MSRAASLGVGVCLFAGTAWGNAGTEFFAVQSRSDASQLVLTVTACNPDVVRAASIIVDTEGGQISSSVLPAGECQVVLESGDRVARDTALAALAFRIRSDIPVFAQQFIEFDFNGGFPAAALLADRSTFGTDFVLISMKADTVAWRHSVVTIVAPEPTHVDVTVTADTVAGAGVPALTAGETYGADLPAFGVLQLASVVSQDLTGTMVRSDAPVEVFGGCHSCGFPDTTTDYVQEMMLPTSAWGTRLVAAASFPVTNAPSTWRIVAATDGTVVSTDPVIPGTPATIDRGKFLELSSDLSFVVEANHPVQVGRINRRAPNGDGDPALAVMLPESLFTLGAAFALPDRWDQVRHWVDIVAPAGAAVTVDGALVPASSFLPVGTSGFSHASLALSFAGTHSVWSDRPIAAYAGAFHAYAAVAFPIDIGCATSAPGELSRARAPLWLAKRGADTLFSWEDLGGAPVAYNVYAGTIRTLWDHVPLACPIDGAAAAGGRREAILSPAGNRYLLVSASTCAGEGDTGGDPARSACPP